MSETRLPDQAPGSLHPRETLTLSGHAAADRSLAEALDGGRMHHAWILAGPRGVGKATLAYRLARAALGARRLSPDSLAVDPADPMVRRIATGAHPDLRVATRLDPETLKVRQSIPVEAIRVLTHFFELSADVAGGRRIGIVDAADDMTPSAANALLKTLEEPPRGAILILLAHAPGALLPTIRSRCRMLRLEPLLPPDLRMALPDLDDTTRALARGRPGRAVALAGQDGAGLYRALSRHLGGLPRAPLGEALALSETASDEGKADLLFEFLEDWLARAARAGAGLPIDEREAGEAVVLARLGGPARPGALSDAWSRLRTLRQAMQTAGLDRPAATLEALNVARAALSPPTDQATPAPR